MRQLILSLAVAMLLLFGCTANPQDLNQPQMPGTPDDTNNVTTPPAQPNTADDDNSSAGTTSSNTQPPQNLPNGQMPPLDTGTAQPGAGALPSTTPGMPGLPSETYNVVLTVEEVAKHNTPQNCWMIMADGVVDMSSFTNHPGGEVYLQYCGKDATQAYQTKDGKGTHSSAANAKLSQFFIGKLGQQAHTPGVPN